MAKVLGQNLPAPLRRQLENAIKQARTIAEGGARKALEALAVHEPDPYRHMNEAQRGLRKKLRAQAKQLGDGESQTKRGAYEIKHLVEKLAYDQWHRLLFARFLLETNLLISPEHGVSVSLDDCEELAPSLGFKDAWAVAARFAAKELPEIFRSDDPAGAVELPVEDRKPLIQLVTGLPVDVFTASDSLGWCYQFWQADKKDEVNAAGNKIGADELPAVTQLFTEDYMVDFLLDNTLGAWHAGKVLAANPKLAENARSEDELRQAVALPGCLWKYLRFIKGKDGKWTPAAGTFDGWPKPAKELKCLDPCMGSGHFVVAMFERLVALRLAEEKLDEAVAVAAVIRDNLFGLEIDPRCTQIGAFNLALAAWRRVGHCKLPAMNLACSGLAPNTREADWLAIASDNEKLQNGMERLYRLFKDAPVLGSLINPRAAEGDLLEAAFHELQPLLEKALAQETKDDTAHEMAVTARGLAKAAEILAGQFTLVATNVPYLGQIWQSDFLRGWCVSNHEIAKTDLAFVFLRRLLSLADPSGACGVVMPQGWLFQTSEIDFRAEMIVHSKWNLLARIGENAFESNLRANLLLGIFSNLCATKTDTFSAFDASRHRGPKLKAQLIRNDNPILLNQLRQLENRQHCIVLSEESLRASAFLGDYVETIRGLSTGESKRFYRLFWELEKLGESWEVLRETTERIQDFGGMSYVILWENERGELFRLAESLKHLNHAVQSWQRGKPYWGRCGVAINTMASSAATRYLGERFTENVGIIVPKDLHHLPAVFAFCASGEFKTQVSLVNPKLNVEPRYLANIPFDLAHWQKVAAEKYPHGLPKPFSSDPTQWLFNGHPKGSDQPLHVAVARLLGYQWPRQTGSSFPDCPSISPDGLDKLADDDGIVCLSATKGEAPAAERLRELLARAWGKDWSVTALDELLKQAGYAGKTLDDWLLNGFFEQHCALFHHRPFIWHVWDGHKSGFSALVNYHKLDHANLEKLTYAYLGDWIRRQQAAVNASEAGSDTRLQAAKQLQATLMLILEGEPPYDIFVRWKPLSKQAIGWNPDLNDGVRLNIRPFLAQDIPGGKKGAGILRSKPNIKWEKDRGKEPMRDKKEFPWFWGWDEKKEDFAGVGKEPDGNRWNDCHYTGEFKQKRR